MPIHTAGKLFGAGKLFAAKQCMLMLRNISLGFRVNTRLPGVWVRRGTVSTLPHSCSFSWDFNRPVHTWDEFFRTGGVRTRECPVLSPSPLWSNSTSWARHSNKSSRTYLLQILAMERMLFQYNIIYYTAVMGKSRAKQPCFSDSSWRKRMSKNGRLSCFTAKAVLPTQGPT